MSYTHLFRKFVNNKLPGCLRLFWLYLLGGLLALVMLLLGSGADESGGSAGSHAAPLSVTDSYTTYLPFVSKPRMPPSNLWSTVTKASLTLPFPLAAKSGNWCTWGFCSLSPRLYHEPLIDGRTLVGWTDSSGDGHVILTNYANPAFLPQSLMALSVRGLVAHDDGKFAILLWGSASDIMWLSLKKKKEL